MPFRLSHIHEYDAFIALDIGTYKARALVCRIIDSRLHILAAAAVKQSRKDMQNGEITDLYAVSRTVSRLLERVTKTAGIDPPDIVMSINSSRLLYDTLQTNSVRSWPDIPVTLSEIDDIIARVEGKSLERLRSKIPARLDIATSEMKLVTSSLSHIAVDGRSLSNPVGATGKNIRLQIINVFVPVSEYSAHHMIAKRVGKHLISLVPVGMCLPKLVETSDDAYSHNVFVDLGAHKTTVIVARQNQILGINVLPFGFSLLSEHLERHTRLSAIEREEAVIHPEQHRSGPYAESFSEFYRLFSEGILVAIEDIAGRTIAQNCFLSGLPVQNPHVLDRIVRALDRTRIIGSDRIRTHYASHTISGAACPPEYHVACGLATVGEEVCFLKKDPIAKILRYVIYRYE